jgi:hypothetical protein
VRPVVAIHNEDITHLGIAEEVFEADRLAADR